MTGNSSWGRAHGEIKITRRFQEKMRKTETSDGIQVYSAFKKKNLC